MLGFVILLVFAVFAVLMFTRRMPALLALPAMAIATALLVKLPPINLLNDIVAGGSIKLAPVYVAVFAGAMMGRDQMAAALSNLKGGIARVVAGMPAHEAFIKQYCAV